LDGLRGLAVLLVLFRHTVRPFLSSEQALLPFADWDIATFMINGWMGVDLFFILSGFLITHHILKIRDQQGDHWSWAPYLKKRALRIIPAYYAVLFLAVLGVFPYYEVDNKLIGLRVLYHVLFLQDYLPANIVVAFWSLGVEEKFYLLAPLLVAALCKAPTLKHRIYGMLALLLSSILVRTYTAFENPGIDTYESFFPLLRSPFHLTLDPMLIGILLALIYWKRAEAPRLTSTKVAKPLFWSGAIVFILLSTVEGLMAQITWWDKTLQPTVIALGFGAMTFGLIFGGGPARLFRSRVLFFFARISYSLYLVHLPLVPVSMKIAQMAAPQSEVFPLFFAVFLSLSVTAALVLHYVVEKPFLLFKDRIGRQPVARSPKTL